MTIKISFIESPLRLVLAPKRALLKRSDRDLVQIEIAPNDWRRN
jgi:hypothetical protein